MLNKPILFWIKTTLALSLLSILLSSCSSGSKGGSGLQPDPVDNVVINRGDTAASVGWQYSGDPAVTFDVEAIPIGAASAPSVPQVSISGNTAIIKGLDNSTTYTVNVRTRSTGLLSTPVSIQTNPSAIDTTNYSPVTVTNDNSLSGIFDPSYYRDDSGTIWMAYSSVDYYQAGGNLVQDVSTKLARSDDDGASFIVVTTLGTAGPASVTDTSMSLGCVNNICNGRWVYEVPFLIDDVNDPNSAERFKLYAHKYFLFPGSTSPTVYFLGAIVRWTAPTPDSLWSTEETVLRWNLSPPEFVGGVNLNALATQLNDCIVFTEGSASVGITNNSDSIDFVFSCPFSDSTTNSIRQRVVQLRSLDHDQTLTHVGIPLTADDGMVSAAEYYSAPSLLPRVDAAPILIVTPVINGIYAGCEVFSYTNFNTATLANDTSGPVSILTIPQLQTNFGGACAWDRGMDMTGITLNNADPLANPAFTIQRTMHPL